MFIHHEFDKNHLLASLPAAEQKRLLLEMELVQLSQGQTLYNSNTRIQHVYFPTSAVVSLLAKMDDGSSLEVAMVVR
jgi:CRP-like cAMP-binding protein